MMTDQLPIQAAPSEARRGTIARLRQRYETELFEHVLPFWETHSPDDAHGGYYNCLSRDGTCYDTTKYSWLHGRQVWMFSTLYRTTEPRDTWLQCAEHGLSFLRNHALRPNGQVFFSVTEDGAPIYQQRKIFSECFYVMGLAEYAHATGRDDLLREAHTHFEQVWAWSKDLSQVGRPRHAGQVDASSLAIPMILLNLIEVITDGERTPYQSEIDACLKRIQHHIDPDTERVYETVRPDGTRIDTAEGRLLNPGHAIEAGWFVQHWAQRLNRPDLQRQAVQMVRWSHATGWDDEYGGLFYFLDADGYSPTQLEWFMKLWWPHCEALYAHLLNYALTGAEQDWTAFTSVHEYTFTHFPDPGYGEWFGYLNRDGTVTHRCKGAPYKGCFHVPRTLWLCGQLLRRLEAPPSD